jgi:hypothetical protein
MRGSGGSQAALHLVPGTNVAPRGLDGVRGSQRVLLTSFDWTGAPAETRVRVVFVGGRAYLRVSARNPLLERLWNQPRVSIAPCAAPPGSPLETAVQVEARVLAPHEQGVAEQAFAIASALSSRVLRALSAVRDLDLLYVELR